MLADVSAERKLRRELNETILPMAKKMRYGDAEESCTSDSAIEDWIETTSVGAENVEPRILFSRLQALLEHIQDFDMIKEGARHTASIMLLNSLREVFDFMANSKWPMELIHLFNNCVRKALLTRQTTRVTQLTEFYFQIFAEILKEFVHAQTPIRTEHLEWLLYPFLEFICSDISEDLARRCINEVLVKICLDWLKETFLGRIYEWLMCLHAPRRVHEGTVRGLRKNFIRKIKIKNANLEYALLDGTREKTTISFNLETNEPYNFGKSTKGGILKQNCKPGLINSGLLETIENK